MPGAGPEGDLPSSLLCASWWCQDVEAVLGQPKDGLRAASLWQWPESFEKSFPSVSGHMLISLDGLLVQVRR